MKPDTVGIRLVMVSVCGRLLREDSKGDVGLLTILWPNNSGEAWWVGRNFFNLSVKVQRLTGTEDYEKFDCEKLEYEKTTRRLGEDYAKSTNCTDDQIVTIKAKEDCFHESGGQFTQFTCQFYNASRLPADCLLNCLLWLLEQSEVVGYQI